MKIALAQLEVGFDKEANLAKAITVIKEASQKKADLLVLPEVFMANLMYAPDMVGADVAEPLDGAFVGALSDAARQYNISIICGIYEKEAGEDKRCYNSVIFLDNAGVLKASYRKTHLYDAFSYQESAKIIAGAQAMAPVETPFGKIGLMVCYELRFPEIARTLALKGADIIIVPTAWVGGEMKREHLQTLAQARAIENTVFLCLADQTGGKYIGHSAIYDPMGRVLDQAGFEEKLLMADLDIDDIQRTRQTLSCLSQRRSELYDIN